MRTNKTTTCKLARAGSETQLRYHANRLYLWSNILEPNVVVGFITITHPHLRECRFDRNFHTLLFSQLRIIIIIDVIVNSLAHTHAHTQTHTHTHTHIYIYIYVYVCVYVCMCMCMCVCGVIYVYIYIYICVCVCARVAGNATMVNVWQ